MRLLHGEKLAKSVRKLFAEENGLRCAVAFWGPELAAIAIRSGARVVFDLSMNGTSKRALEAFGIGPDRISGPAKTKVRILDGLHTKMFLGQERCILGSPNASGNALGHGGRLPTLFEAAIEFRRKDDPKLFDEAESLWKFYWKDADRVTIRDYHRAPLVAVSAAARDFGSTEKNGRSLLQAVLREPESFEASSFIFGDSPITTDELKEANDGYRAEFDATPAEQGRKHICSIDIGDHSDDRLRASRYVLFYWFGPTSGFYCYHDIVRVEHGESASFYGRRSLPAVRKAFDKFASSGEEIWSADKGLAASLSDADADEPGERFVVFAPNEVSDAIARMT